MLSVYELNNPPFVVTSTISWNRERMARLNVVLINLHPRLTTNLYNFVLPLIIYYIIWNITKFYIVSSAILFRCNLFLFLVNHSYQPTGTYMRGGRSLHLEPGDEVYDTLATFCIKTNSISFLALSGIESFGCG